MSSLSHTRRLILFAVIALMLPLLAACAGDDDDDDATSTPDSAGVATATTADVTTPETDTTPEDAMTPDDASTPEGTADAAETPDSTPDAMETPDSTPDAVGTADETPDAMGTPDGTPDAVGTPDTSSTPDADTTPDSDTAGGPFGDITDLQAEVPNFTLDFTGTFDNVPDDTGEMFTADIEMMLAQSAPDIYHLRLSTTGDDAIDVEMWALESSTFVAESGGTPIELPGEAAGALAPTDALTIIPPVDALETAEEVGQEDVNGRSTTHYRVDPEQAALVLLSQNVTVTNPEGDMDIWIDDELGIILQMTADITFENEDGSDGGIQIDYLVSDIDETEDIEAPS